MVPDCPPEALRPKVHDLGIVAAEAPAASAREVKVYFMMNENIESAVQGLG
jgi:dissimilatory sulfite reductase (desulfoviridin) alpha/beta subunit